jgi:hypothetical protein
MVEALVLLDLVGPKIFDYGLRNGLRIPAPLSALRETAKGIPQEIGKFGYIANVLEYPMLHRGGSANGHNVICVGHDSSGKALYMGFGTFFATPKTEAEILDQMHQDTILPPTSTGYAVLDSLAASTIEGFRNRETWNMARQDAQAALQAPITEISFSRRA